MRSTLLHHRQAHYFVRPRRRLQPAEDIAGVQRPAVRIDRRDDVPLEPLIEPLGRRLVGQRQSGWPAPAGPGPTRRSPTPVPSASGSAPPATTASPAAHRRPSPQPRSCAARPGSSSDRQRTTVSRRARRRPGAQLRATKSLRAAVPGPTSRVKGGRSATDRRFGRYAQAGICSTSDQGPGRKASAKANRTGGCALEDLPRSVTRNRGPGVPSPRRDPWRTRCLLPTWKTTNNVSNVAGRSVTSASGSGSRSRASHRKPGPAIEITGSGSARRHRARGHLTGRAVDADRRTAGGASPARPPRRRRHHLRSPGTSTRGVRSLMWYGARSPCRRRVSPAIASYSCCSSPSPLACSRDRPRPASGRSPASSIPPPAGTASTPTWCTPSSPSSPGTAQPRNRPRGPRA